MSLIETCVGELERDRRLGARLEQRRLAALLRLLLHLVDGLELALLPLARRDGVADVAQLGGGVLVGGVELDRLAILEQRALERPRLGELLARLEVHLGGVHLGAREVGAETEVVGATRHQLHVVEHRLVPVAVLLGDLRLAVLGGSCKSPPFARTSAAGSGRARGEALAGSALASRRGGTASNGSSSAFLALRITASPYRRRPAAWATRTGGSPGNDERDLTRSRVSLHL
jgi:hypothetical protein